jgi:spoIIIJ-associated protein
MCPLCISAASREEALAEALKRLELPKEALEMEWSEEASEELLAGAKPFVELRVVVRPEYVAEKVAAGVRALLEKMGFDAKVELKNVCEFQLVNVESEDEEILVGRRGETLDAIHQLVLRMTNLTGRDIPLILLDVNGWREKRILRLQKVCLEIAADVRESGKEEYLDPMNSIDRKIVHHLVRDLPGVTSYSRGEELNRHVIIGPDGNKA